MKKNSFIILSLLMVLILALTGCAEKAPAPGDESTRQTVTEASSAITSSGTQTEAVSLPTQDREGNPIKVPSGITKIISLAPATAQVIDTLGLKDKIIAVDTQTPLYAAGLDTLPQFDMMAPDCEAMLALKPDIVFVSGMSMVEAKDPFKPLRDMGVCVAVIPSSDSIDGVKKDIQFIADCLGESEQGNAITEAMQKDIDEIAKIGAAIGDKKTVMFEISALPDIYSFGNGVFLNEMLDIIGAKNVFADQKSWIAVTEESAVSANPDVILTNVNYIEDPVNEILSRKGWQNVTAVKNKAVYYIDNAASSLPNQHIVDALKQMAKAVYPEEYASVADPFAK